MHNMQTIGRGIQKSLPHYAFILSIFVIPIINYQLTILSAKFCTSDVYNSMEKISAVRIGHAALTYH